MFPVWGEELENGNAVWLEPPCKMDRQWWQGRSGPCPPIQWWKEVKRTFPSGTQKVGFPDPLLVAMNNALNNLHSNPLPTLGSSHHYLVLRLWQCPQWVSQLSLFPTMIQFLIKDLQFLLLDLIVNSAILSLPEFCLVCLQCTSPSLVSSPSPSGSPGSGLTALRAIPTCQIQSYFRAFAYPA